MKAQKIVDQPLELVTSNMHAKRRLALSACVSSILKGNPVSVTHIGRGISNSALEKHKIKRADRLCSNAWLQSECADIYQALITQFGHLSTTPIIWVDWSDLDDRQEKFLLRASIAIEGRAISLYQEVHTLKTKDKPSTHKKFLIEKGEYHLTTFGSQDAMAWETQGAITNRNRENLGTKDRGIAMFRRLLREQIQIVKQGEDPVGVIRDPAINQSIQIVLSQQQSKFWVERQAAKA